MGSKHTSRFFLLTLAILPLGGSSPAQEVLWQIEHEFGPNASFNKVAWIGDVNADGKPDFAVGGFDGWIRVVSGQDGSTLFDVAGPGGETAARLAGVGDFDGDGIPDFAEGNTTHNEAAGIAVVYSGAGGAILATITQPGLYTGYALAGLGDVDGDGYTDLAVGNVEGRVDVYRGPGGTWLRAHLGPGTRPAVAGIGDVDGDGRPDYVIGWPQDSTGGLWAGTAKVISGASGALIHQVFGSIPHAPSGSPPSTGDHLGRAVAGVGDLDGDGLPDFACGAPGEIEPGWLELQSRVLGFSGADASLLLELRGRPATSHASWFGGAIASAGDINGDGVPELLIGAQRDRGPAGYFHGSINVFSGRTGARLWRNQAPVRDTYLGTYVAVLGDLNGDGLAEFASGDRKWNDWAGRILVWKGFRADAEVVCAGEPNSVGQGAALEMGGSLGLASYGGFKLIASGLPALTPGLFFYGPPAASQPFGEGRLCVGSPFFRVGPPIFADGAGRLERALDFAAPPPRAAPARSSPAARSPSSSGTATPPAAPLASTSPRPCAPPSRRSHSGTVRA